MKLSSRKQSSWRYFVAGLKPFGRFMFWGPLCLLGSIAFSVWYYQNNPQLLGGVLEQREPPAENLLDSQVNSPNNPNLANQVDTPIPQNQANQNPETANNNKLEQNLANPNKVNPILLNKENNGQVNTGEEITNTAKTGQQKTSSMFPPLLPSFKSNSQNVQETVKPIKVPLVTTENYLQKAIEQRSQSSGNNAQVNSNYSQTAPNVGVNNRTGYRQYQSNGNNYFTQPAQPQVSQYQAPYNGYNNSGQYQQNQPQYQQNQPPTQSYQVPYSTYQTQPQYVQPSTQSNYNGYNGQVAPTPQNSYQVPTTQIQPAIQDSSGY